MKRKNRFNLLFEQIMNSLDSLTLDLSKFNFKKDEDGNIICAFKINRDDYELNVIAKDMNNVLSFDVTNYDGKSTEFNEKRFATLFNLDYDDFMKALEKFRDADDDDKDGDETDEDATGIKSFKNQIEVQDVDDGVKMTKMITTNNTSFMFKVLNDPAVDNYCECTFQCQNEDTNEIEYFKALLDIKIKNSLIVKIIRMDEDGNMQDIIAPSDLESMNPELFDKFKISIKKMEKIIWDK